MMQQEHNLHVQRETIHAGVKGSHYIIRIKRRNVPFSGRSNYGPTVPKITKFNIFTIQLKPLLVTGSQT